MRPYDRLTEIAIRQAELGHLPDALIRAGMRRVIASRLATESSVDYSERELFWQEAWNGPIAMSTDVANQQHYEVPPAFFDLVLGPRRKYSSAWWPEGVAGLHDAEDAMLGLYAQRADLADGQSVLDLGSGWGAFALWAAHRYSDSRIIAMSNSHAQAAHIKQTAADRELSNVDVVTADINDFDPQQRFDRIVSIEMLEHVRNHRALFEKIHRWVEPDGAVFTHVFAHQTLAYTFDVEGPGTWMARTFFTDGVMPSRALLPRAAARSFDKDSEWWINGTHYARTLEAWLARLDANLVAARQILYPAYGDDVDIWLQRWRMFFMACSEMFGLEGGSEWGVVHQLFRPRQA